MAFTVLQRNIAPPQSDVASQLEPSPGAISIASWAELRWLRAAFSTRVNGVSQVYGPEEQNLGWTREDEAPLVAENRRRFLHSVAGDVQPPLMTLRQIHSGLVHAADEDIETHEESPTVHDRPLEGDGLHTGTAGRLLGVLTADCVPVLIADTRTRAVAALHAGWRGTLARIVERGVDAMQAHYGSRPEHLIAAIGPAIRPCCFAVGEEVQSAFAGVFPYADELFTTAQSQDGKPQLRLDLQNANQRQLLQAGLAAERIEVVRECTACCRLPGGRRKYFSYRAERGVTGRMLSVIGTV